MAHLHPRIVPALKIDDCVDELGTIHGAEHFRGVRSDPPVGAERREVVAAAAAAILAAVPRSHAAETRADGCGGAPTLRHLLVHGPEDIVRVAVVSLVVGHPFLPPHDVEDVVVQEAGKRADALRLGEPSALR